MPYGKVVEDINRKVKNGEIDPVEAEAFIRELDTYGFCNPEKVAKATVSLRRRKINVVEK